MEVGGWVQVSLRIFLEKHPKIALNQYGYLRVEYHVYFVCIYALLQVVSYYDLSFFPCH